MADNVVANAGAGGSTFATDDIGGIHYPIEKLAFGPLDTATLVTAAVGLPVGDAGGSLTVDVGTALPVGTNNIGDVDVLTLPALIAGTANIGDVDVLTVITGTGATNLGKAEDAAHVTADVGVAILGVRRDTAASGVDADGDYATLNVNTAGRLYTASTIDAAIPAGTNNIGDVDVLTVPAPLSTTGGGTEATALRVTLASDSTGLVSVDDNSGSLTVDVGTALPTGTNNIGDVDVLTIAAGDNNIGNVDVVTLPNVTLAAGTNTNEVVGDAAHDAAAAGNPVLVGGYASAAAPADVSADADAVRAWMLRNGAQAAVLTAAGALIGGDAANGLDVDVTRLPALVAGTANIGDVDVLTVPADPFGVNADASSATGSISAKLRFIAGTGIPVTGTVTVGSHAVTNAGTFATQVDGNALTALQLIDNPVLVDDAAFTPATSSVMMAGFEADETTTDSVDEGDAGAARMTLDRKLIVTPQPHTAGGLSIYRSIDLDEGALEVVKSSAGCVYGVWLTNTATATRWVKFYDATSGTIGTGTPVITIGIPGNATDDIAGNFGPGGMGIEFTTGISIGASTGVADADTGAPGANDVIINVFYK